MEPIIKLQFENGRVTIDHAQIDVKLIHHFVLSSVRFLLQGSPRVETLIDKYGAIELIFLVAQYYQHHENLLDFAFPEGYEVPNFKVKAELNDEDTEEESYRIYIQCDEPASSDVIISVVAGLFLGAFLDDFALTHFAVHEIIADYIDQAYEGDEDNEDRDITYS